MSELEEFAEQLQDLLKNVKQTIEVEIPKMRGAERLEKCSYLKNRLARAKQVHRSMLVELREAISSGVPKIGDLTTAEWDRIAKDSEAEIAKLLQDVEWAETSTEKDGAPRKRNVDDMTAKEITGQALLLQEQTQEKTGRVRKIVEETIEIGAAVNEELRIQGEQLDKIKGDVEKVESNLKRADKQMRVFMRRMATDKIFLVLIFLTMIGLIGSIVFKVLKDNKLLPGTTPPAPTTTVK